jgi:hypothetical protein
VKDSKESTDYIDDASSKDKDGRYYVNAYNPYSPATYTVLNTAPAVYAVPSGTVYNNPGYGYAVAPGPVVLG